MRKSLTTLTLLTLAVASRAPAAVYNFMTLGVNDTSGADTAATTISLIPFTYNSLTNTLAAAAPINVDSSSPATELTLPAKSGTHDGMLRLSGDGNLLTFAGYRAAAGDPNPIATSAATVNRAIGVYNIATGAIDTSTSFNDAYNFSSITAVATQDGKEFWTAGASGATTAAATTVDLSGGIRYAGPANIAAHTTTNIGNVQTISPAPAAQPDAARSLLIAGGNLYVTTASQGSYKVVSPADGKTYYRGAYQVGANVPLTQATANTYIPLMNDLENGSDLGHEIVADASGTWAPKSDIVFADLNPAIPGFDTAYGTGGKQEFEKWSLIPNGSGGYLWQQISIFLFAGATDINGLAIDIQNNNLVDIFATNDLGIYHFTDALGYQSTPDAGATSLAKPAELFNAVSAGVQLRGIAAFPVPEPTTLSLFAFSSAVLLKRRNRSSK